MSIKAIDQSPSLRGLRRRAGEPIEYVGAGGDCGTIRIVGIVTGLAVAGIWGPREKFTIVIPAGSNIRAEFPRRNMLRGFDTPAVAEKLESPKRARESVSNSLAVNTTTASPSIVLMPRYVMLETGPVVESPTIGDDAV
jgi:hypothetical protein